MFTGACAGSTTEGVKCMRILLLIKYGLREIVHTPAFRREEKLFTHYQTASDWLASH